MDISVTLNPRLIKTTFTNGSLPAWALPTFLHKGSPNPSQRKSPNLPNCSLNFLSFFLVLLSLVCVVYCASHTHGNKQHVRSKFWPCGHQCHNTTSTLVHFESYAFWGAQVTHLNQELLHEKSEITTK